MMKYVTFVLIGIFLTICQAAFSETIYLKDGQMIRGEVLQKSKHNIKLKVDGRLRTYYLDQIDRIEEDIVAPEVTENIDFDEFAYTRESKVEWILKLMEANGTREVLKKNIAQIVESAPDDRKEEMRSIFDLDGLMEELIPIFDEHYTEEDIKELIKFFESPIGQKTLKESPAIMKEVMNTTVKYFLDRSKM